jgi:hypothetical protein
MTDLQHALEILSIAGEVRSYPGTGGVWFGRNHNMADATFEDWGLARAAATILNAVRTGQLVPVA